MRTHETILAPRADWTLARMHYLRVLGPAAAVCFGTELTFIAAMLIARMRGIAIDFSQGLDLTAIMLALFVALPIGAAVFSRPFKEQHILLFQSLPISRLRQWALFACASFAALLTVHGGLALLRPGAARMLFENHAVLTFLVLAAIGFTTGLCFALIFVRNFAVYLSAYIASVAMPTLLIFAQLAPYVAYEGIGRDVRRGLAVYGTLTTVLQPPPSLPISAIWTGWVLLILGLAAASAAFYVRGEMTLPRVQVRNALLVVMGVLALAMTGMLVTHGLPPSNPAITEIALSPDGHTYAVWRKNFAGPWENEITVYELTSSRTSKWKAPGLLNFFWTKRTELVACLRDVSPLRRLFYLRPTRDHIERWSAAGAKLGYETSGGRMLDFTPDGFVVREGATARAFSLRDGHRGRELLRTTAPDEASFRAGRILFESEAADPRVWRVAEETATEIPRVPIAKFNSVTIFDGSFYSDRTALLAKIESTWPASRASGDRVGYSWGWDATRVFAIVGHPSTAMASLLVMETATKRWSGITDAVPITVSEIPREQVEFYDRTTAASILITNFGFVLFAERSGDRILHRAYDSRTGVTTTLYEHAADDPRRFLMSTEGVTSPPGRLLTVSVDMKPVAEVFWHGGTFEPIPVHGGGDLEAIWPDATQVRRHGNRVTIIDPHGKESSVNLNNI